MIVPIGRLVRGDWETLRAVRLEALADAPYAFGSTHAEEAALDDEAWELRITEQAWFVALDASGPVGVASGGQLRDPDPGVRTLRSMWVHESFRGRSVAEALLGEVAAWARGDGAVTLTLWATRDAARARAFYAKAGFIATGEVREMDPARPVEMARYELTL